MVLTHKFVSVLLFLIAQICTTAAFTAAKLRMPLQRKLFMGTRPVTYTAVKCPWKPESQLLVKDFDLGTQQASLFSTGTIDVASGKSLVDEWIEKGVAFWADDDGLASLHASEQQKSEEDVYTGMSWGEAGQYINFGTERQD